MVCGLKLLFLQSAPERAAAPRQASRRLRARSWSCDYRIGGGTWVPREVEYSIVERILGLRIVPTAVP